MTNKVTLVRKVLLENEIDLGNKGNLILIKRSSKKRGKMYRFGKINKAKNNPPTSFISFLGKSYHLNFVKVFGEDIAYFREDKGKGYRGGLRLDDSVKEIITGKENIIKYLGKDEKYKYHVEVIKKIK